MRDASPLPEGATTSARGAAAGSALAGTAGMLAVLGAALAVFALQVAYLHLAAAPDSDEGVNAEVARRLVAGARQYRDVPSFHMPLLQWLLALGFEAGAGMYALRLACLALNCLAVVPLYGFLVALHPNRIAAFTAVGFYLTFPAMVHHDFRFVTIRPLANDLLLAFLWLGARERPTRRTLLATAVVSVLSVLLFLPAAANLAAVATAAVWRVRDHDRRRILTRRYVGIAMLAALAVLLVFVAMPGSFAHIVLAQITRAPVGWGTRVLRIAADGDDVFFYAVGLLALLWTVAASPRWRVEALAMLAMVVVSIFGPANFLSHYLVVAAPALCFGIFLVGVHVEEAAAGLERRRAQTLGALVCLGLLAVQLMRVSGSLGAEWLGNRQPDHHALIARLAMLPDPLLTLQPIYAVESGRRMMTELDPLALRAPDPRMPLSTEEVIALGSRAGAILVERRARLQIPAAVNEWMRRYRLDTVNSAGIILVPTEEAAIPHVGGPGRRFAAGTNARRESSSPYEDMPFGGIKQSGYGRETGELGMHEFVNQKLVRVLR